MTSLWRKVFINKKNGQASISLPKKKMTKLFNGKYPNRIRILLEEWD